MSNQHMQLLLLHFFEKMGQSRPLLFIFVLFQLQFQYKLKKKLRWCAWELNPGLQDGRRRRNHGAMAATNSCFIQYQFTFHQQLKAHSHKLHFTCLAAAEGYGHRHLELDRSLTQPAGLCLPCQLCHQPQQKIKQTRAKNGTACGAI